MKRTGSYIFWTAVTLLLAGTVEIGSAARTVELTPDTFTEKVAAMRLADGTLVNGYTFQLAPGHYYLDPQAYVDSTCGNCEDPLTPVAATVGLHISGRRISIAGKGEEPGDVVIHTGAGYGLLFRGCEQCRISNVTITGGVRDPDANATDAAIVVQDSQVLIENCVIRDNLGDSTVVAQTVVGIMGISGRESAVLTIKNNRIIRNSWDGIALYRGARAIISNNLIDGVDKAAGAHLGGGRGVGIGLTWNARANIQYNRVTRYWKGIGVFVDAEATIQENVIEEIVTWGVAYWDGGRGRPVLNMTRNVIFDTGACGIAITRESGGEPMAGYCRENVVFHTGQNPKYDDPDAYCHQCPIAIHARPDEFVVAENFLFDNRRVEGTEGPPDTDRQTARVAAMPFLKLLQAQPALKGARCFRELAVPGSSTLYR